MKHKIEMVGYHGTMQSSANNILKNKEIYDSMGDEEWLGKGKYFYDKVTNALEYIIKKYNNNKEISMKISYNRLMQYYCILRTDIKCEKEDILDLDEIVILYKFVWMWEQIYSKVKEDEEFKKLEFKDGYMIDYIVNEIYPYKIVIKTFDRIVRMKQYRDKTNEIFDKTRIVYQIKQKYICVKDSKCLSNINLYNIDCKNSFDNIQKLSKIINRRENYET